MRLPPVDLAARPVYTGWHCEHVSTVRSPAAQRVVSSVPHVEHVMRARCSSGWIGVFKSVSFVCVRKYPNVYRHRCIPFSVVFPRQAQISVNSFPMTIALAGFFLYAPEVHDERPVHPRVPTRRHAGRFLAGVCSDGSQQ